MLSDTASSYFLIIPNLIFSSYSLMGSSGSKIDNSESITLCRGRSKCLSKAFGFCFAFSDAHVAYFKSLKSVSESLHQFIDGIDTMCTVTISDNLQLPVDTACNLTGSDNPKILSEKKDELDHEQKGEELDVDSGSHLHFPSDSDLSDCGSDDNTNEDITRVQGHHHFAANLPMSSSSNFLLPYSTERNSIHPLSSVNFNGYTYSYNDYYGYPSNYNDNHSESSDHPITMPSFENAPGISSGELLNIFNNYVMNYVNYTVPGRDWNGLREVEGIPNLEDVEDSPFASSSIADETNEESDESVDDDHTNDNFQECIDAKESIDDDDNLDKVENNNMTSDVKETVEVKNEAMLRIKRYNSLSKAAAAVKSQFDKASESATELFELIEVGKRQYHPKNYADKRVTCIGFGIQTFFTTVISDACSHLSSKNSLVAKDDENASFSLSSTLQKLIIWEKKLYNEVMAVEKLQFSYGKKCREMRRLIEKSAEQQKLDRIVPVIKKLSMKIRLSIRTIGFISTMITKLRDEALRPQVCQLIKGLGRMWSSMYECYRTLHQAIPEENFLHSSCGDSFPSDAQIETTKQLALELIQWTIKFSTWINAQKDLIKALNGWLLIAIRYAKEETPDRVAPYSPSKLDAPSIFVICNQWEQAISLASEKEAIISMQNFSSAVLNLWIRQKAEQCQKLTGNEGMEKEQEMMEKEEKETRRIVKAWSKKLRRVSGEDGIVMPEDHTEESDLHVGLLQMVESMENYCATNLKAYEELNMRIEEENMTAE